MPINPSALSSPEPDKTPDAVASDGTQLGQSGGVSDGDQGAPNGPLEPVKRQRRNKAQMIADAVVPGDAEMVDVKDLATGAKVQRAWREAVGLVASGAVEFVDKTMKYAVMKMEQQAAAPAFAQNTEQVERDPAEHVIAQAGSVPPGAAVGDEVRVGSDTLYVGNGGVLTSGVVAVDGVQVKPKRRWQRELGSGSNGPWESVAMTQTSTPQPIFDKEPQVTGDVDVNALADAAREADQPIQVQPPQNGNGGAPEITVTTEKLPRTAEEMGDGIVKIGTGILEKINLGDYNAFQIGPISISRTIFDDGRRTQVQFADGRTGEVITAAAEGYEVLDNTVEFIAGRFRGQLKSFLQSQGMLKQPVS